ncbi:hypothetical protein BRD00_07965 [Halobacteriales archaeon QS_8_69_26]|nr:MAG: hypothetical protein BRD00_07965 [Halobacteriales archaeon QS_8_69_26]
MPVFDRGDADEYRIVDRFDGGVGWIAHPDETGRRASHAVRGDDGVWVFDPLDAPGVDELVVDLGEVTGVAVLSNYHARDAGVFACRHGVPVYLPGWMDRVADRVDAPVERYREELGDSGFAVRGPGRFPGIQEAVAYREDDGTLYVPESLGTAAAYTVGDERLGPPLFRRALPPRGLLAGVDLERILVGHGEGVFEDAAAALEDALSGARRRFPRALLAHGATQVRALVAAARD